MMINSLVFYLLFLIYIALESFFLNLDACKVCMQTLQTWQKLRLGTERVRSRYGAGPVKLLNSSLFTLHSSLFVLHFLICP